MVSSALRSEKVMRGRADTMSDRTCESMQRSYRDTVRSVDSFLDRLRTDLAADDPAMILHSDHGESFGEHGNYGHHHRQLYEENVHVPYVVHDGHRDGTVSDPTSLATIPEVALSIARTGGFDPKAVAESTAVATSECGTNRALRDRQFKYVEHDTEQALFELSLDPAESRDVSSEYPERCAESRSRLDRIERHRAEIASVSHAARVLASSDEIVL
jgi:arylsulfatase